MSLVQRLIDQLEQRGLRVEPGKVAGELLLRGPAAEKTPEIIRAVKAFKPQLLERFGRKEINAAVEAVHRAAAAEGWEAGSPPVSPPPAPVERPTARPAGVTVADEHETVREGVCRAKVNGWLAWAHYTAGHWYWFEETRAQLNKDERVVSYRVFTADGVGYAGPSKFRELFAEGE